MIVLPVAYKSENTWNGWGRGGRMVDMFTSFAQKMDFFFLLIVYCLETLKFVFLLIDYN